MRCEGEKTIPQSPSVTAPFTQGGLGAARWSTAAEEGRRASGRGRFFQASAASAEKGGHRNRSDGTGSGAFFEKQKNVVANKCSPRRRGGLYRARTCDPIDVNDVLYQLSQQTG